MNKPTSKKGFFISQIGVKNSPERSRADEVYEFIVIPVCVELGIDITRSDRESTPGPVGHQIIRSLTTADVVVADVTGRNPNVNYELGVAHSFARRLVMLIDSTKSLPFDTQGERVIEIGDSGEIGVSKAEAAKYALREALTVVLADDYSPENVVSAAATTQSLYAMAPDNPIASELAALKESMDTFGLQMKMVRRNMAPVKSNRTFYHLLKEFVEFAVDNNGVFTHEDLKERLTTPNSPEQWDSWVAKMGFNMRIRAAFAFEPLAAEGDFAGGEGAQDDDA
jgi:hypothetical protein